MTLSHPTPLSFDKRPFRGKYNNGYGRGGLFTPPRQSQLSHPPPLLPTLTSVLP